MRSRPTSVFLAIAIAIATACVASPASAMCRKSIDAERKTFEASHAVFTGKVLEIRREQYRGIAKLKVLRAFKGANVKTIELTQYYGEDEVHLRKDREYFVYAFAGPGARDRLAPAGCDSTKLLVGAKTDLKVAEKLSKSVNSAEDLLEDLEDESAATRAEAAAALGNLWDGPTTAAAAERKLAQLAKSDPKRSVRDAALGALTAMRWQEESTLDILVDLAKESRSVLEMLRTAPPQYCSRTVPVIGAALAACKTEACIKLPQALDCSEALALDLLERFPKTKDVKARRLLAKAFHNGSDSIKDKGALANKLLALMTAEPDARARGELLTSFRKPTAEEIDRIIKLFGPGERKEMTDVQLGVLYDLFEKAAEQCIEPIRIVDLLCGGMPRSSFQVWLVHEKSFLLTNHRDGLKKAEEMCASRKWVQILAAKPPTRCF